MSDNKFDFIEDYFQKADLLPAIVQEKDTNEVLMLAYMNRESMQKTFEKCGYKLIYGKRLQFGKKSTFRRRFYVYIEGDGRVDIGDDCFFNNGASLNSLSSITIGDRCVFGEDVKIYDHNHKFRDLTRPVKDQGFSSKPVVIGSDTWVCSNCVILQGVTIGSHCVIGANCLVWIWAE